jgi:hypothetical protein
VRAAAATPFEAKVRALLEDDGQLPATVIAERVGWTGSITWFRESVKRLRPEHRKIDPADRLVWEPGDAAQCDLWFPPCKIPLEDGTAPLGPPRPGLTSRSAYVANQITNGSGRASNEVGPIPSHRAYATNDGTTVTVTRDM